MSEEVAKEVCINEQEGVRDTKIHLIDILTLKKLLVSLLENFEMMIILFRLGFQLLENVARNAQFDFSLSQIE